MLKKTEHLYLIRILSPVPMLTIEEDLDSAKKRLEELQADNPSISAKLLRVDAIDVTELV